MIISSIIIIAMILYLIHTKFPCQNIQTAITQEDSYRFFFILTMFIYKLIKFKPLAIILSKRLHFLICRVKVLKTPNTHMKSNDFSPDNPHTAQLFIDCHLKSPKKKKIWLLGRKGKR